MDKSDFKIEGYLPKIKEALISRDKNKIDALIEKIRFQISESNTEELKQAFISLWKNWFSLCAAEELEEYSEYLPDDTDLFSLKGVEDAILMLAGVYENEEDEYAILYEPIFNKIKTRDGYEAYDTLLIVLNQLFKLRKNLINSDHHPLNCKLRLDLVERLNALLMAKQKDLYNRAIEVFFAVKPYLKGRYFNLEATLDFDEELPEDFQDQSNRMKKLWKYMSNPELNNRGEFSIAKLSIYDKENIPSLNSFLYLSDYEDDWSHLLSGECGCYYLLPEIQTLRNIGYAMHNLSDHLNYSIHEVIYATKFKCELNFEIKEMEL
ncbi:hypothetical protein [Succinivibrio dextrinosolvens]|uniref:hypothetical protein n=1 Tax=Succinivibrio dextrinosolvens TaxID=83771 RepID=UPI00241F247E|nr:hypothetical protein [Succinivibrio dextrinosolvens]MBE6424189.1 hypothetical protein [Succinivibrio dextrinosolvens]